MAENGFLLSTGAAYGRPVTLVQVQESAHVRRICDSLFGRDFALGTAAKVRMKDRVPEEREARLEGHDLVRSLLRALRDIRLWRFLRDAELPPDFPRCKFHTLSPPKTPFRRGISEKAVVRFIPNTFR
jgi:hypothetical protein